jgi:tetratricopeptide (TPR) repeat protein
MNEKTTLANTATADLQIALRHTASLLGKQPAMAEKQAMEILRQIPGDLNALQLLGTARRLMNKPAAALEPLREVVGRAPDFALAQQELGLTLVQVGEGKEAIEFLRRSVKIDATLSRAWKALGDLLTVEGDEVGSQEAYRQHLAVTAGHPDLVQAANCLFAGKLGKVETLCRAHLKKHPTDVSAIRMLADVGIRLSQFEDAQNLLERCLELVPDYHMARNNYAQVLFKRQQYDAALHELEVLIKVEPHNPGHHVLKASIFARIGRYDEAIEIYHWVLARYPAQARIHLSLGHALKTVGRQAEAIDAYRSSMALQPKLGEAYWSLANLKTFRFEDHEIEAMRVHVSDQSIAVEDYSQLGFALGKALEDREEFSESFSSYVKGNASRRRMTGWDADEHHQRCQNMIEFFNGEFFASIRNQGCPAPDPVFVVGLPRAGSTLLEQILASHSQVEGTMELPDIISIARRLNGKKRKSDRSLYPGALAGFSAEQLAELGQEYLERTQILRTDTPFFIDKMPNNFVHIGLIHSILPNAKIIDARRHPMACCFSGFKQYFASGQNFTYGLSDIGRYYRDYVELMDHWDKVLPGRVLLVQYEDVVADTEKQVRRILDYCGLPFEAACLDFYKTRRAIRTASSEQVRQPIYNTGVDQWRNYLPHLAPLTSALGPVLERYPI